MSQVWLQPLFCCIITNSGRNNLKNEASLMTSTEVSLSFDEAAAGEDHQVIETSLKPFLNTDDYLA